MSYIVAFVSFQESHKEFPVQCFSTDVKLGDNVVVRRGDGKLKYAKVQHLKYLNWECNGRIECKVDDITHNSDSEIVLPKGSPLFYGLSNAEVFIKELKTHGWIPVKSKRRQYRAVLGRTNASTVAYLFIRKNGIDIQVLSRVENEIILPYSMHNRSFSEGTVAHHFLAHTTFNLFEGLLRFSKSFINNEINLERYFIPQGVSDKRTEHLKTQSEARDAERKRILEDSGVGDIGDYSSDMFMGYHMN